MELLVFQSKAGGSNNVWHVAEAFPVGFRGKKRFLQAGCAFVRFLRVEEGGENAGLEPLIGGVENDYDPVFCGEGRGSGLYGLVGEIGALLSGENRFGLKFPLNQVLGASEIEISGSNLHQALSRLGGLR